MCSHLCQDGAIKPQNWKFYWKRMKVYQLLSLFTIWTGTASRKSNAALKGSVKALSASQIQSSNSLQTSDAQRCRGATTSSKSKAVPKVCGSKWSFPNAEHDAGIRLLLGIGTQAGVELASQWTSADCHYNQEHLLLLVAKYDGTIFYWVSGEIKAAQNLMQPLRDWGLRLFCIG